EDFSQGLAGSIPERVTSDEKQVGAGQMEDLIDQLIGSNSQKTTRLAAKLDLRFFQDPAKRPMFFENGCLGGIGKKIEIDLNSSKLHRLLALVHQQRHFAKIIAALPVTADDLETNPAAVKVFEGPGHSL